MNANNDNEMSQELSAYLDGELNEADTARVDEALGKNPELTRELNQLKNTREMLRNLPKTTAPDGFTARAIAAATEKRTRSSLSVWLWRSGVAAAVIIAAVTISYPLLIKQTTGTGELVQQQASPKKIGEIARDLKDDNELNFSRAKKTNSKAVTSRTESIAVLGTQRLDGKSVAELAAVNRSRNNEVVWTDNIEIEKKNVEKLLAYNGLQVVPETQEVLESNQAMNLSSNQIYNSNIDRAVAVNGNEVEYLVYGSPEQVSKISEELRGKVQMRQVVSQLPEDSYRYAIVSNADSNEVIAAKTKDKAEEPSRGISRIAAKSLADSTKVYAPLKEADATLEPQIVTAKQKRRVREPGEKLQQQVAMMITLRYRPQEQLNPKQADAITKLECLNQMPLSQKQNIAVESVESKKTPTSKPASEPSAK